jgi:hypothetical protein
VKRGRRTVVITNAEPSPGEERRSREIRYLLMMSVRAVCLVAAAVLVSVHAPLLWIWLPLCAVGMAVVPWIAVLLANERPPKARYRVANRRHPRATVEKDPTALPSAAPPKIIDADE